jgi:hypothetical protein
VDQSKGKTFIRTIWSSILALRTPVTSAVSKSWGEGATNAMFKAFNAATGISIKSVSTVMLVAKLAWTGETGALTFNKCDSELKVAITKSTELSVEIGAKIQGSVKSGHELDLKGLFLPALQAKCDADAEAEGGALQVGSFLETHARRTTGQSAVDSLRNDLNRLEEDIKESAY